MLKKLSPLIIVAGLFLAACASLKGGYAVPASHPEELGPKRPLCTECHGSKKSSFDYAKFDHTLSFARGDHAYQARQQEAVCSMCHRQSSCSDCHAIKSELKPSERRFSEPYRQMPHRGDYRTRHQMDGRLDPASCFNCHGNPRAATACAPCHGK